MFLQSNSRKLAAVLTYRILGHNHNNLTHPFPLGTETPSKLRIYHTGNTEHWLLQCQDLYDSLFRIPLEQKSRGRAAIASVGKVVDPGEGHCNQHVSFV